MEEYWKEKLGYTSGTILLWSLVLINLYPIASHMQLTSGLNVISSDGKANVAPVYFYLLTLLIAIGTTSLLFAITHIASRGMWIAGSGKSTDIDTLQERLNAVCEVTFSSAFYSTIYMFLFIPGILIPLPIVLIQRLLYGVFSLETRLAGIILYAFIVVLFIVLLFSTVIFKTVVRRKKKSIEEHKLPLIESYVSRMLSGSEEQFTGMIIGALLTIVFMLFFIYFSYTAKLELKDYMVYRSKNDTIEISVELGGATSQIGKVMLGLKGGGDQPDINTLHDLGRGQYIGYLNSSRLSPGLYTVEFEYRYPTFTSKYPFFSTRIRDQQKFIVAE